MLRQVFGDQVGIKFDKVTYDFGTFSDDNPVHKTTFTFTNVGKAPLVINQIVASCGCRYSETPKCGHSVRLSPCHHTQRTMAERVKDDLLCNRELQG